MKRSLLGVAAAAALGAALLLFGAGCVPYTGGYYYDYGNPYYGDYGGQYGYYGDNYYDDYYGPGGPILNFGYGSDFHHGYDRDHDRD